MGQETEKILNELDADKSITEIFKENSAHYEDKSIGDYIEEKLKAIGFTKAKVIRDSGINKRFFYDIMSGKKLPSRRYVIRILMAMKLELKDVQWYLKAMDYSQLYARNKSDSIIIYCINHQIDIKECNTMLNKVGLENLGFENI